MSKQKVFLFSYHFDGAQYSFEIPAETAQEARERLSRIAFAKYDGELAHKIPAFTGASAIVRLLAWMKNR